MRLDGFGLLVEDMAKMMLKDLTAILNLRCMSTPLMK